MQATHANRNISILYRHGQRYLASQLEGYDIEVSQLPILMCACRFPGKTQEFMSCYLAIDKGFIARAVASLEERGYIRREPDYGDRRANLIYPTDKGQAMRTHLREMLNDWQDKMTLGMTPEQRAAFGELLAIAADNILKNRDK